MFNTCVTCSRDHVPTSGTLGRQLQLHLIPSLGTAKHEYAYHTQSGQQPSRFTSYNRKCWTMNNVCYIPLLNRCRRLKLLIKEPCLMGVAATRVVSGFRMTTLHFLRGCPDKKRLRI